MFKLKWKIAMVIFLVSACTTLIVALNSWNAYRDSITQEALSSLDYFVQDQWAAFNFDLVDIAKSREYLANYIERTFDLKAAQSDPSYMTRYLDTLRPLVQTTAQHQLFHSAYVYFAPELFGQVYGVWYADLNHDDEVEEQSAVPMSYFDPSQPGREWFYRPLNQRITGWTSPYQGQLSSTNQLKFISLTGPSIVDEQVVAVVGADYFLDLLVQIIRSIKHENIQYAFLLDENYRIIVHPDYSEGTLFSDLPDKHGPQVVEAFEQSDHGHLSYDLDNAPDSILSYRSLDNGWIFATVIYKSNIYQGLYKNQRLLVLLAMVAVAVGGLMSAYFGQVLSSPLEKLAKVIQHIGEGEYEIAIDEKWMNQKNEIGILASALDRMRDQILIDFEDAEAAQRELEKLNEELVARNERLQSLSEAKSQFLANMSHEIRTPLNGIMGSLQLLSMEGSEENKELIDISRKSTATLVEVLNSILDHSKIEASHLDLEKLPFSLNKVMEDTLRLFAHSALLNGVELTMQIDDDVPDQVIGDAFRLKQVLANLVGNAVKYTQKGTIQILSRLREPDDGLFIHLEVEIKDTGIGIPADKLNLLFKSFSQVDSSDTRVYGGTGLGLFICKGIVEKMGGEISVESEYGVGSSFRFTCVLERQKKPESEV